MSNFIERQMKNLNRDEKRILQVGKQSTQNTQLKDNKLNISS